MSAIQASQLELDYRGHPPVRALCRVDLAVETGTITAVLGPSGCGKTTLLRAIAGLEQPSAGTITLDDRVLFGPGVHVAPERRHIGLVPQEGALFPHLDVAANLAFGLRKLDKGERAGRVKEMLDLIGLVGYGSRRPHELSGGEQQRVALGRALAPRPVAVLLDEPFSALDAGLRGDLRDQVSATLRASGTTAVLVTHDQSEALSMADSVAVMRSGRIVQSGAPAEIYRNPCDLWTARFLGDVVELPATASTGASGPAPHGTTRICRPEQLRRVGPGEPTAFSATVVAVRFQGPDANVILAVEHGTAMARWPSTDLPAVGDRLAIAVSGAVVEVPNEPAESD